MFCVFYESDVLYHEPNWVGETSSKAWLGEANTQKSVIPKRYIADFGQVSWMEATSVS